MPWYSAHIIIYVKKRENHEKDFFVLENIVLIDAENVEIAWQKAIQRGNQEVVPDESLTYDNEPAEWIFAGVRKIVEADNLNDYEQGPLTDGSEATYLEYVIENESDIKKLASNKTVNVSYLRSKRWNEADDEED